MRLLRLALTATVLWGCDHPAPAATPAPPVRPVRAEQPAPGSAPDAGSALPLPVPATSTVEVVEVVEVAGTEPALGAALSKKGQVLLTRSDLLDPQVWYDEDTMPLHAHVVVDLAPDARARYEAFVRTHPKARFAIVVNGAVEQVRQATTLGVDGRLFITPRVPTGANSNAAVASALCVSMGGKPRTD